MFITGTRGAIVVPLGSLLLFALISKNIKLMSAAAVEEFASMFSSHYIRGRKQLHDTAHAHGIPSQ